MVAIAFQDTRAYSHLVLVCILQFANFLLAPDEGQANFSCEQLLAAVSQAEQSKRHYHEVLCRSTLPRP